jgi:hypothetical protein
MRKVIVPEHRMADEGHAATDTAQAMLDRAYDAAITSGQYKGVDLFVGGTGSGKSVTSEATPLSAERRANAIILESHAENAENLAQKIDKALEAGLPVDLHVVVRDPVESYKSVVERYNRADANKPGSGKVVPVNYGSATHEAVIQNVPDLMDRYAGDPGVRWHFIDNTGIPEAARAVGADDGLRLLGSVDTSDLPSKFNDVLDNSKLTRRDLERFRDQSLPSEFGSGPDEESGTASAPAKAAAYGERNVVFTKESLVRAQEAVRRKLNPNRLNAGIDPTVLPHLLTIAGYHLEAGSIKFADWSARMVNDLGEGVIPILPELYERAVQNLYWRSRRPGLPPEVAESLRDIIAKASRENIKPQGKGTTKVQSLGASSPRLVKASDLAGTQFSGGGTGVSNKNIIQREVDGPEETANTGSEADDTDTKGSTYSMGSTHLSKAEVHQLMARPDIKITDKIGAGATRPPRHHLFPQPYREWFWDNHRIDIDRYTIEMNWGWHSAIHTMGWNRKVKEFIDRESLLGIRRSRRGVFRFINQLRRDFNLKGRRIVPYED